MDQNLTGLSKKKNKKKHSTTGKNRKIPPVLKE